jgi:DNA-binding PadR family transcriptional regulator
MAGGQVRRCGPVWRGTRDLAALHRLAVAADAGIGDIRAVLDRDRLEDRGWLDAEWGTSENNRRAKFYEITASGRRQLLTEVRSWQRYANAVQLLLQAV